jgi:hypothetical protein
VVVVVVVVAIVLSLLVFIGVCSWGRKWRVCD